MKNNKRLIIIIALFFSYIFLTGFSPRRAYFYVKNMTDYSINIELAIALSESERPFEWYRTYHSEDGQSILFCVQSFFEGTLSKEAFILPPKEYTIGFNWYSEGLPSYDDIPPLEKLKLFYSVLNITDSEGNVLLTLDTITENDLEIDANEGTYEKSGNIYLVINPVEQSQ